MKVKFSDVVRRANTKEDRFNTDKEFYVGGEHMITGEYLITRRGTIAGSNIGPMFYFGFKKGQVLLASRSPDLKKAGMVTFDGICSEKTFVIETKDESVLLQDFLPAIVRSESFWKYANDNQSGSVNHFINWTTFANYEFDLPDIETQRKLSTLLWAMERTKTAYKNLIAKTDELVKSQFVEMFGQPGDDSKGWGLTTLGKCCVLNPKRPKDIPDDAPVSFVAMPSVSELGEIDTSVIKTYSDVKKGLTYFAEDDVLFAKITPCMENGKGCVAKGLSSGIGVGSTEFHVLRPIAGKSNPYWLYCITIMPGFREAARKNMTGTGGQLRVPVSYLDRQPITLPPISLQEEFERFFLQTDKSKYVAQKATTNIKTYGIL